MIILSASGFEPAYRGPDITVVLVTPVNTGAANRSARYTSPQLQCSIRFLKFIYVVCIMQSQAFCKMSRDFIKKPCRLFIKSLGIFTKSLILRYAYDMYMFISQSRLNGATDQNEILYVGYVWPGLTNKASVSRGIHLFCGSTQAQWNSSSLKLKNYKLSYYEKLVFAECTTPCGLRLYNVFFKAFPCPLSK